MVDTRNTVPQDSITLYTWQHPVWDITKEKRDLSYGPQRWGDKWDKLQLLYEKLEKKIGTPDFLFCFAEYEYWMDEVRKLWVLDTSNSEIFKFLDSKIWETMIEDTKNNKQPEDTSWDKLIVERSEGIKRLSAGNNSNITPLIRVPISPLIKVLDNRISKGPKDLKYDYKKLPTSEHEAKRFRCRRNK